MLLTSRPNHSDVNLLHCHLKSENMLLDCRKNVMRMSMAAARRVAWCRVRKTERGSSQVSIAGKKRGWWRNVGKRREIGHG
jgi:hypothetical protein